MVIETEIQMERLQVASQALDIGYHLQNIPFVQTALNGADCNLDFLDPTELGIANAYAQWPPCMYTV